MFYFYFCSMLIVSTLTLQSNKSFFKHISTNNHVAFHMESFNNFVCNAYYPNGISWVHLYRKKISHFLCLFELFHFIILISVGSWKCFAKIIIYFLWDVFCVHISICSLWVWSTNDQCIRSNRLYYQQDGLVFTSNWNETNATNYHCNCTASSVSRMLWQYRMYSRRL